MKREEWIQKRTKALTSSGSTTPAARRQATREWDSREHQRAPGDIRVAQR